ncbi:hypothetical protein GQ44DRAFT_635935 [Phaeosphaeriaceae sp. PMI808]|nr:hypothetical protein GQ44DRAFT_635935 [Phaeosphaeriaceae sp. PMI808]
MDPFYSQDECVAAIRDYYDFLTKMFMDPSYIIEPPEGGWPNITRETMQGLKKSEEIVSLLRSLPYVVGKPYSVPDCLPGSSFCDWTSAADRLISGKTHPEGALITSEGEEHRFGGKVPRNCVGIAGGMRDRDIIILDAGVGLIHWMKCPDHDDDSEDEDSDDGMMMEWGPCWPVRYFFEMAKNHFRELNFIPMDSNDVIDIWTNGGMDCDKPVPKEVIELLQGIYRKHGWPNLGKYRKEECLAEIKQQLDEKYPEHHRYRQR